MPTSISKARQLTYYLSNLYLLCTKKNVKKCKNIFPIASGLYACIDMDTSTAKKQTKSLTGGHKHNIDMSMKNVELCLKSEGINIHTR